MNLESKCFIDQYQIPLLQRKELFYWPKSEAPSFYLQKWGRNIVTFVEEDKSVLHNSEASCSMKFNIDNTQDPSIIDNFPCFLCQRRISFRSIPDNPDL